MKHSSKKIIISILASFLFILNANAISDALKVKIINGTSADETVIRFLPTATTGFDGSWDAYKLFSSSTVVPALFSKTGTSALSVNALPSLTSQNDIALYSHIKVNGTYTFQAIELGTGFSSGIQIVLEDLVTGITYNFKGGNSVSIPMTVNTVTSPNRFVIHVSPPTAIYSSNPTCYGFNNGSVVVSKTGNTDWNYELKDYTGTVISSVLHNSQFAYITSLSAGTYTLLTNSSTSLPDTSVLTITEPLQVTANFSSVDSILITDGAVNFTNTSLNASSYSWDFGDASAIENLNEPSHQYSSIGTFTVNLMAADSAGCSSTYSKTVTVYQAISYVLNDITITNTSCYGSADGSISIVKSGNTNYYYQLTDNTGTVVSSAFHNNESAEITGLSAGNYTLTTHSLTSYPDTTLITVTQPLQVIAQFSSADSVLTGEEIYFTNNSINAISYTWDFGDGSGIVSATETSHTYYNNGTFTVNLTASDSAGCSAAYSKIIIVHPDLSTGIASLEKNNNIVVFQRDGGMQISIQTNDMATMQIAVYNNNGQKLYHSNQEKTNSFTEMIPLTTSGTYIVHALINNKLQSQRIAIVK